MTPRPRSWLSFFFDRSEREAGGAHRSGEEIVLRDSYSVAKYEWIRTYLIVSASRVPQNNDHLGQPSSQGDLASGDGGSSTLSTLFNVLWSDELNLDAVVRRRLRWRCRTVPQYGNLRTRFAWN